LLLTATLRLFALPWRAPGESHPDWRGGFLAAGVPDWGVSAFDGLFGIVVAAPRRPLDVRCLHCRVLGRDEGRLLQIVSLFQHRRPGAAAAVLGDWLPPAAQRLAAVPAEGLARALGEAGLLLPWRHLAAVGPMDHQARANPGLSLVQ
jgi:hypothetical protein